VPKHIFLYQSFDTTPATCSGSLYCCLSSRMGMFKLPGQQQNVYKFASRSAASVGLKRINFAHKMIPDKIWSVFASRLLR